MTNLDSILKSSFANKGLSSQGSGFSSGRVWMWELDGEENWVPKNWCFWTVWRLLRVPWTARRSKQSILKEISPGCSLEGLMLKLKLQYFGHLMRRVDSLEKTWCWEGLGAGGEGDDRGWDGGMVSLTRWTWVWVNSGSWWWTGRPGVLRFMGSQRVGLDWATELTDWTDRVFILQYRFANIVSLSNSAIHLCYQLKLPPSFSLNGLNSDGLLLLYKLSQMYSYFNLVSWKLLLPSIHFGGSLQILKLSILKLRLTGVVSHQIWCWHLI